VTGAAPDAAPDATTEATSGADLAREALARAKAASPGPGRGGSTRGSSSSGSSGRRSRGPVPSADYSGPGPDERDPQTVGATVDRLVDQRRWQQPLAIGSVIAAWPQIVGAEVAAHSIPERVEDGVLVVQADSTAWATQLRLLGTAITTRLAEALGDDGIRSVRVLGPAAPSWKKGPRSVPGRGPRDTYG
jgi:predicted nucleic acid-binding Zn ribbon protein